MGSKPSSQPVSETEAIRKEAKNIQEKAESTQEEENSSQPPSPLIIDSTQISQSVSVSNTSLLLMFPDEILIRIMKFLDMKTLIFKLAVVCTSFCPFCKRCPEMQHPFPRYISHIYERRKFSRGGGILQSIPEDYSLPLYFQPNVNLSLKGITQPNGMIIHVFTTSDSKEIHFTKIVSMIIESLLLGDIYVNSQNASEYLDELFKNHLDSLKNLKISGFYAEMLWKPLSMLKELDWLHWTYSISDNFRDNFSSFSGLKRLHLEFEKGFNLIYFPTLPSSLEGLSFHFSNLNNPQLFADIAACKNLKKM